MLKASLSIEQLSSCRPLAAIAATYSGLQINLYDRAVSSQNSCHTSQSETDCSWRSENPDLFRDLRQATRGNLAIQFIRKELSRPTLRVLSVCISDTLW